MSADWQEFALTDLYDISSGLSKPAEAFGSGYPFVSFKDVFGNYFLPRSLSQLVESTEKERHSCSVKRGDVFLTRTSETMHELGMSSVALNDYPNATFNGFTKRLRPKENPAAEVHPEFIGYCLRSPKFRTSMLAFSTMSTRASLNNDMISRLNIKLPPIKIQKEIAKVLRSLDNKIHLNTQTNQTLESIAQAIFKSWFVDFEPVKAKMAVLAEGGTREQAELAAMGAISGKGEAELAQLQQQNPEHYQQLAETAALFPSAMVESELGEIPEGWEVLKIESVLQRLTIKNRYTKTEVYPYGKTPVFEQGTGILLGYHNGQAEIQASPENPAFIFGDHTCVMHLSCSPFDISANVIPLKGNKYPTIWTYYAVLGKQEFQEYRRHWSELAVKDVIAPVNDALTYVFERMIRTNLLLQEELKKESSSLAELRDSLLPKLLSGELNLE